MPIVFLSLGSNVGDRRSNLESACRELERYLDGLRRSPIYETEPQEVTDQPSFLNMVVEGRVDLNPQELLAATHSIEGSGKRDHGPSTSTSFSTMTSSVPGHRRFCLIRGWTGASSC